MSRCRILRPPARLPDYGLTLPCRVLGVISADRLRIELAGPVEIDLVLLDCWAPERQERAEDDEGRTVSIQTNSRWIAARDRADELVGLHRRTLAVHLPRPLHDRGWYRTLGRPGQTLPGWLYLCDGATLNEALVSEGLCAADPAHPSDAAVAA